MSQFIQQHHCTLSTLGPVHLGTGEDYLPTHYIIDDGYLHAFDDMALLKGLGPQGLNNLLTLVEQGDDSAILAVRREILKHKDTLIPLASHSVYVRAGIENTYQKRVVNVAQRETGKDARNINNALKIARTAANLYSHTPELTGSAIKGAIRTAWLNHQHLANPDSRFTNDRNRLADRADQRGLNQLGTSRSKDLLGFRNVTEDPFFHLKISDGQYSQKDGLSPSETLFAVSVRRKQQADKEARSLNTMLECISPWRDRCFEFDLRFADTANLRGDSGCVPLSLKELALACNSYYFPKLLSEIRQLGETGRYLADEWNKSLTLISNKQGDLYQAMDQGKAMLLRLGKHSGAVDKTLDNGRAIKILGKKGEKPTYRDTTTEVRLAGSRENEQTNLLPFGWVVIEFDDTNIPALREVMHQQSAPARQRLVKEQQRQQAKAETAQKLAEAEAEKARQAAEAEAKRQAEEAAEKSRQEALNNMSEEKRSIEQLRHDLENSPQLKGATTGNSLYVELKAVVEKSGDWAPEDRKELKEVAEAAFIFLGINYSKKKTKANDLWKKIKDA